MFNDTTRERIINITLGICASCIVAFIIIYFNSLFSVPKIELKVELSPVEKQMADFKKAVEVCGTDNITVSGRCNQDKGCTEARELIDQKFYCTNLHYAALDAEGRAKWDKEHAE